MKQFPPLHPTDAALMQRGLAQAGFYKGSFMGLPGAKTRDAYRKYIASITDVRQPPESGGTNEQMRQLFIQLARAEVGVTESGGNNRGARVQDYQDGADWLDGTGWAWCAAFICFIFDEMDKQVKLPFSKPEGAGAFWFEDWGNQQNLKVLSGGSKVKAGDIVIFKFSHIGIATEDELPNKTFLSVEGNTSGAGSRDGDGVYEKQRPRTGRSGVRSIVRPFP